MIPIQDGEPNVRFRKDENGLDFWTASYDDIRYITAHETADMICQILSGDAVYFGLGFYSGLFRDYIPDVISEKRYPKGKEYSPSPKNPSLEAMGFNKDEVVVLLESTTVSQRKAIKQLLEYGLTLYEIKEQLKLK